MFFKKNTEEIPHEENFLNVVYFNGCLQRGLQNSTIKVKGMIEDSGCEIPVHLKSLLLKQDVEEIPLYSFIKIKGHLEFPIWKTCNGNVKTKLIFVADEISK